MDKDADQVPQKDEPGRDEQRDETEHPHDDPDARSSTEEGQSDDDGVEEASRDSFPSSDPPAW